MEVNNMLPTDVGLMILIGITFLAAIVNGALGYGFSSLTVPVALLFYINRILSPSLVLVEVMVNAYTLVVNRRSLPRVWRRTLPILLGLIPGILLGSYALSTAHPGWLKFFTYVVLLPLIILQAAGLRRPIRAEQAIGVPLGAGVGALYSLTTISGPPLALMLNNQGFVKEEFRAALGLVRVVESTLTAIAYYFLGLYTIESIRLLSSVVPGILIGLPLGIYLIRHMHAETFRRICMSFDAWVVGFGLSRVLIDLKLMVSSTAYSVLLAVVTIDGCLLSWYFNARRVQERSVEEHKAPPGIILVTKR